MSRLYLLEPQPGDAWAPFDGVRPVAELRAGAWLIRERWEAALGLATAAVVSEQLAGFVDVDAAPVVPPGAVQGPAVIVRSDAVPPRAGLEFSAGTRRLTAGSETIAWRLGEGERWTGPNDAGQATEVGGRVVPGAWALIDALEALLADDCREFTAAEADPIPDGVIVLGDPSQIVLLDAAVEPGVIFDTRHGAVVLTEGVEVRAGTRLEGPLFAGRRTRILGGEIRGSSFGPECRVRGEMATTVMVGYGNKSHDGFVGHSVIGAWVNLGAGTITSNLKNTYGPVRLDPPSGRIETGRTFLGSLIADHAKTAIGTLLSTGSLVGAAANVVGLAVPRWVPPLSWPGGRLDADGLVRIAERVFSRRGIPLTAEREAWLRTLHTRLTA